MNLTAQLSSIAHVRGCQEACLRCLHLIDSLTPEQYAGAVEGQSSVGAHLRHCLDHFVSFFRGWSEGEVDYDARERDPRVEKDRETARSLIDSILADLAQLESADLRRPVVVLHAPASGAAPERMASTLGRELAFLSSHSIHHLALMLLLAQQIGADVPQELGVAYSTAAYRKKLAGSQG